jgi:DNA-binding MarR family transcriptional regulator
MRQSNQSPCLDESSILPGIMPEIFQRIDDLERRLRQFQGYTLKEAHLTLPQYYILSLLLEEDGRPFKDLAEALACTRATVTGIVDTLERKSLVARKPHPSDRRSTLVKLTGDGRQLLQSTQGVGDQFQSCCCDALPPEESRELSRLLKKLSDALPF